MTDTVEAQAGTLTPTSSPPGAEAGNGPHPSLGAGPGQAPRWDFTPADRQGPCGIEHALSVLTGKWTLLIVRDLLGGTRRFSEIHRATGANPKPLTESLRRLEDNEIVSRRVHAEVPPRVEYSLTSRGRSLAPILTALATWGQDDLRRFHGMSISH